MNDIAQLSTVTTLTLEGALSLMIFVIAYKIYRARISTHSGCCGDRLVIDTTNPGMTDPGMTDSDQQSRHRQNHRTLGINGTGLQKLAD